MGTETQYSWEDWVRSIDPDFDEDNLRPIVYYFPHNPKREDQTQIYDQS